MAAKGKDKHSADIEAFERQKYQMQKEIQELKDRLAKVISAQANFDSDFKKKKVEMKKLNDEFKKYKKETKLLLEEKSLLIKDYEDRVAKLNQIKQQQVEMLNKEKEDLENEHNIAQNQLKILNLKENFYRNKSDKLLVQKEFLVRQVDGYIDTMNTEYNKLKDLESQKDFMISVKKSNKNVQEVYSTAVNNLKYLKEVIEFMNFAELLNNQLISIDDNETKSELEKPLISKSVNTSNRSDSKPSRSFREKTPVDDKDIERKLSPEKLSIDIKSVRKHPTALNVVDAVRLTQRNNEDKDFFGQSDDPYKFK